MTHNTFISLNDFDKIRIKIASPEDIEKWSNGEVLKPETINYRTQKPERDGLFCEKIFGPTKDYECYCGKYKKIRYKGVVCDKCGVEVVHSSVRRERMGHISLAVPVAHIWYLHGVPSTMSIVLDMSMSSIEKVVYFASFVVLEINEEVKSDLIKQLDEEYEQIKQAKNRDSLISVESEYKKTKNEINSLSVGQLINEQDYFIVSEKYGNLVRVGIGANAIYELLKKIDFVKELEKLKNTIAENRHDYSYIKKELRRYRVIKKMAKAGIKPEWTILTKLPVLPPDLRPMVQLDGGRFAASDLNDLYRRIINRNNRLKKLIESGAPEVITRNERRMLQEAVDALIDNTNRRDKSPQITSAGRKLRSLSDMLRGKRGRFRQNLLGKRVDYSGRSVIVVGPELQLNECGLPKKMALELFKPHVISKLIEEGYVHNVKNASKLISQNSPEVWDILERIIKVSYVLLNRAPTLHRLGIEAFQPKLVEGKSIRIHPLVCYAFNADFDGDQMAVHVPLSKSAVDEAKNIILASKNLLKPASGEPTVHPNYDIIYGCYYITSIKEDAKGKNKSFSSKNDTISAYQSDIIDLQALIKIRINDQMIDTTVGRILFNNLLPKELDFINEEITSKKLKKIVSQIYRAYGSTRTAKFVDDLKDLGFEYATISGLTIAIEDVIVPDSKHQLIKNGEKESEEIENQFTLGLITENEKKYKIIECWQNIRNQIEKTMISEYKFDNNIFQTVSSGARGSFAQVIQMGGMKGLVVNPAGEIITHPVKSSFKEGLDVYEYFISSHAARKGKSDTSLKTSDAGYLTRRLVDVAQDVVVSEEDCHTKKGMIIYNIEGEDFMQSFDKRILGRVSLKDVKIANKIVVKANEIIGEEAVESICKANLETIEVRSPIYCQTEWGICQKCYGRDLATGEIVKIGEAVGIIAAQAIGEPGTQLTMQTFHVGGVQGSGDVTTGLPRVEELFEARPPKKSAVISQINGKVKIIESKNFTTIQVSSGIPQKNSLEIPENYSICVKDGDEIKAKQSIATHTTEKAIRATISGTVKIDKKIVTIASTKDLVFEAIVNSNTNLLVKDGEKVEKGQILTDDYLNLSDGLKLIGSEPIQQYIINEVQKIYQVQGQDIHDKHIEIILRKMFSKRLVLDPGDSEEIPGQLIDLIELEKINTDLVKNKKKPIGSEMIILGVSRISLKTKSFLSAASFQETTNVLIEAASSGQVDNLEGLKENVIIGRLIPAGTGFKK